jgi:hypothetical protein
MVKLTWSMGNILVSRYEPLGIYYDTEGERLRFKITAIRQRDQATVVLLDDTRFPPVTREGQGEIVWDWGPYPPRNPSPLGDPPTDRWDIWDIKIEVFDENNNKRYEFNHYLLYTAKDITYIQYFDENMKKLEGIGAFMLIVDIFGTEYMFSRKQVIGATQVSDIPTYAWSFMFPYPNVGVIKRSYIEFYSEKGGRKYYILEKTTTLIPQYPGTEVVRVRLYPQREVIIMIELEITDKLIELADRRCRELRVGRGDVRRICYSDMVGRPPNPDVLDKIKTQIIAELNDMLGLKWTPIGARRVDTYVYRFYFVSDPAPIVWILVTIIVAIITAGAVLYEYFRSTRDIKVTQITYDIVKEYRIMYKEYLDTKAMIIDMCKKLYTNPNDVERCIQQNAGLVQPPSVPLDKIISTVNNQENRINELEQLRNLLLMGLVGAIVITVLSLAKR